MMLWTHIEVTDFSILYIFKYRSKQYKNANIANLVCYGKTRMRTVLTTWQEL